MKGLKLATAKDFKGKTALLTASKEVTLKNKEKSAVNFGSLFDLPVEGSKDYNIQGFLGEEGNTIPVFGTYTADPGKAKDEKHEKPAIRLFTLSTDEEKVEYCVAFKRPSGEGKKVWFSGKANGKDVNFFLKA